jgi:hypothetical protein
MHPSLKRGVTIIIPCHFSINHRHRLQHVRAKMINRMFPVRKVTRHKPNPRRHPAVHKCSCNFQGVRRPAPACAGSDRDLRKLRMFDLISYLRKSTTVTFASSMLTTPMPHGQVAHCGRIFITSKHPPFTEIPRTLTRMFPIFEVLGMTNREGWCAACLFTERPNNGWRAKAQS